MSWKRIILFGLGAFLVSEAAAMAVGLSRTFDLQALLYAVAVLLPTIVALSWLAVIQRDRTAAHVSLAGLLHWSLSIGWTLMSRVPELVPLAVSLLLYAATIAISLGVGLLLRKTFTAGEVQP